MHFDLTSWQLWALLSASFAALTAIFAKIGVSEVDSNFATFVRTLVIVAVTGGIVASLGGWPASFGDVPGKTWIFLVLSGLATGASWLCYFRALKLGDAAQVAPIDKLSVVLVAVFAAIFLGEKVGWQNWLGVLLMAGGALLVALKV